MKTHQGILSSTIQKLIIIIYMIMMSVQIIGIEGMTVSPLKAIGMGVSPLIFLLLLNKFGFYRN